MSRSMLLGRIETSAVVGAILIVLMFIVSTNGLWLSSLPSVLNLTAQIGLVVIGQALLMTAGEVDLSVGSVFAFAGVMFLVLLQYGLGVPVAMLVAVVGSAAIGVVNGLVTVLFRVPSMIVTLGSLFVFRGLTYISTSGYSMSVPRPYRADPIVTFLKGQTLGLSNTVYIVAVLMLLFVFILGRTRFGGHVQAVGGEPGSALANGVSPSRIKVTTFSLCSALAGMAGIMATCQEGNIYSSSGRLFELDTIAAAVIGGATLRGGVGSVWGAVIGVFILSSLKGGLLMMGAPTFWYQAFVGLILIGFLILSKALGGRYLNEPA